jgi:hypothetical protein
MAPAAFKRKPAKPAPTAAAKPPPAKPAPTAVAKPPPAKPALAKPAPAAGRDKPAPAAPEIATAILGYLADRPAGVKLTELQAHLSAPRMELVRMLNAMITDKRVHKDEKLRLYFVV